MTKTQKAIEQYQVSVMVRGWEFCSMPLSQGFAKQCAADFKQANPLSNPSIREVKK